MLILAFDTSTARGSVAVLENERILAEKSWTRETSHGEFLTQGIDDCVKAAGLEIRGIERIAVGHGPGSFTGIRIAVNAARTLGFALGVPLALFDTTEILAAGVAKSDRPLLVAINAQKNAVFATTFRPTSQPGSGNWQRAKELELIGADHLDAFLSQLTEPHLAIGDGFEVISTRPTSGLAPTLVGRLLRDGSVDDLPQAVVLGRLAWSTRETRPPVTWKAAQALYIRASGAEEKLRETQGK